jgi:dienelactone hydrolase
MAARTRLLRTALVACGVLATVATVPRALAGPPESFHGPDRVTGLLHVPAGHAPPSAAVLIVHDTHGLDPRSGRYVNQLTGAGILVLEIEVTASSTEGPLPPLPGEDEVAGLVTRAAGQLAQDPRVDPGRVGALGFGIGGRAVVLAPPTEDGRAPFAARVMLYPGCASLAGQLRAMSAVPELPASPTLILHGGDDPANGPAACEELLAALGAAPARRVAYRDATYAWDLPQTGGSPLTGQPWPRGAGTVPARAWPELADLSAAQAAAFLTLALGVLTARPE